MTISCGSEFDPSVIHLDEQPAHNFSFAYPQMTLSTEDKPKVEPTQSSKHILILGGGVSGLLSAWMLLDQGYRVTIIADDWAWFKDFEKSRMTSQIAGALWEYPPGGCGLTEIESVGSGWSNIDHYREWATQSFDFYNKYDKICNSNERTGHSFGLQMTKLNQFFYTDVTLGGDDEESTKLQSLQQLDKQYPELGLKVETLSQGELEDKFNNINTKIGDQYLESAYTHRAPIINTDKAMGYLMALVTVKGANLETRKFTGRILDFGDQLLKDYGADLILNATGLGARELADDEDVYPVRGAVKRIDNGRAGHFRHLNEAYLVPAQKDDKGHPTKTIFIVPRNDDVLYVGSIIQPNNYDMDLTPDSPEVQYMWNRAGDFMPSLHHAKMVPMFPFAQGLRPFSKKNAKVRADEKATFPLVHNYGHGGSGWTLGVGTARCAVYIVERLLSAWADKLKEKDSTSIDEEWKAAVQYKAATDINKVIFTPMKVKQHSAVMAML
ncbi:hypothetical protein BGW38_002630 [Lunasporangiospora selenospora]|uniref:FAD dependent oxidoreductase domain-containing protein n=1 Tax=Lunasporangiospora selenospora TaxID=979761 RepID=A0A9P6FTV4_9FUNG|nr:hypothetical protein BGW38_002630 [Lunasporangiospora selenospora]